MKRLLKPPYSLRVWMIAGIVGLVVIPYFLTFLTVFIFTTFEPPRPETPDPLPADLSEVYQRVESQPDRWADDAWRREVSVVLDPLGLRVLLQTADGSRVYELPEPSVIHENGSPRSLANPILSATREMLIQVNGTAAGKATWFNARRVAAPGPRSAADEEAAGRLFAMVENHPERWDDPAWQAEVTRNLRELQMSLRIHRPGDRNLHLTGLKPEPPTGWGVRRYVFHSSSDHSTSIYREGVLVGEVSWSIIVAKPETAYARYNAIMDMAMPWIIAALIFGTIWMAIHLAYRAILTPLQVLSKASRQINQGDLEFHIPSSPISEVNEFARAFDQMRQGLKESVTQQASAEQERRLFIAALAHDLRTPLTSVRGYLEGLRDGVASTPEKAAKYVSVALEKTESLARLIESLFAFAKAEYLEQPPHKERLDLGDVLQAAAEAMQPRAKAKSIALQLSGPPEPVQINADRLMLSRVLDNLLDNAIRHTPSGGTVTLGFGDTSFWVHDSGPGIPAEDLPYIFNPLFRGDKARGTRTGGAGLGLAIAQRLIQAHGGTITAANDHGTRFTVTLP